MSRQDLDHAVASQQAAEGQVNAARANLRTAELNLSYTRVTSPIMGLAGVAQAQVGALVGSPEPTLLTVCRRWTRSRSSSGSPRENRGEGKLELVLSDGSVFDYKGRVVTVDRNIDPATGTLGIEALFPNPGGLLRPGQFGRVRAPVTTRKGATIVPQRAVHELQGTFSIGGGSSPTARSRSARSRPGHGSGATG